VKVIFSIEFIRNELSKRFNEFENYFVVDSMPLEGIKLFRSNSSKFAKKNFIVFQIEAFVQVKICAIMITRYMWFVLLKVFLKVLIQSTVFII